MAGAEDNLPARSSQVVENDQCITAIVALSDVGDGGAGLWKMVDQAGGDTDASLVHELAGIDATAKGGLFDLAHFLGVDTAHGASLGACGYFADANLLAGFFGVGLDVVGVVLRAWASEEGTGGCAIGQSGSV